MMNDICIDIDYSQIYKNGQKIGAMFSCLTGAPVRTSLQLPSPMVWAAA